MPSFNTLSALEAHIKKQVYESAKEDLAKEGEKQLTKAIEDTVYARPISDDYNRTGEFKKSADSQTLRSGNGVHLSVFSNPEKMDAHPSWRPETYGFDQNRWLANWLNYGHGGMANYEAQLFIERAQEAMNKNAKNILKKALKKRGIDSI